MRRAGGVRVPRRERVLRHGRQPSWFTHTAPPGAGRPRRRRQLRQDLPISSGVASDSPQNRGSPPAPPAAPDKPAGHLRRRQRSATNRRPTSGTASTSPQTLRIAPASPAAPRKPACHPRRRQRFPTDPRTYKAAVAAADDIDADDTPPDWKAADPVRWLASHFLSGISFRALDDAAYQALDAQLTDALTDSASVARARRTRRGKEGAKEPAPAQA